MSLLSSQANDSVNFNSACDDDGILNSDFSVDLRGVLMMIILRLLSAVLRLLSLSGLKVFLVAIMSI